MSGILILHALGDPAAGQPWRHAFASVGVAVDAPDLPGHGEAGPLIGRCYQIDDPAVVAAQWMAEHERADVIVGVGASGWAAQVVALAGLADRLVLIDGLGGPFVDVERRMNERRARVRAVVALGQAEFAGGLDPRAAWLPPGHQDFALALDAARAMTCPVLVLETPESLTSVPEAARVAELIGGVRHVADATPDRLVTELTSWLDDPGFGSVV